MALTTEQAKAAIKKYGTQSKAAKALGIARSTFQDYLRPRSTTPPPEEGRTGRSLNDFRDLHDRRHMIPKRITEALKRLGDGWEYEANFLRLAEVSSADLASHRDQFSAHVVVLNRDGRRAWAGKASIAEKMREMVK